MYLIRSLWLIGDISPKDPFALSLPKGCSQGAPWLRQAPPERLRKMCLRHVPDQVFLADCRYSVAVAHRLKMDK